MTARLQTLDPRRLGPTVAAFLRMDFIDDISYPLALVTQQLSAVFPVFIYFFVARLIPPTERVGGDYFTFVVIGHTVAIMLQSSLSGFGMSLQRAQDRGLLETLLVEPVPWTFLPIAMNLWRIALGLLKGTSILLVAVLLGADFHLAGVVPFVVLIALGMLATTAIGALSASILVLAKRSQPILTAYGLAASLLAGALFPVRMLPGWLQPLSWVLPHTYVINAARQVLMGLRSGGISFDAALVALGAFDLVVLSVGLWLFYRSLQYARRLGVLGGY